MRIDTRLLPKAGTARRDVAFTIVLGAAAGALVLGQAELLSLGLDRAFLHRTGRAALVPLLLGLAALALLRAVALWASDVLAQRAAGAVRLALRESLTRRIGEAPSPAGADPGELVHTLVTGVEATDPYVARYVPQFALALIVPAFVFTRVVAADGISAAVLVVTGPLVPFFAALIGSVAREQTARQWTRLQRLSSIFLDGVQGLAVLRAFGQAEAFARRIEQGTDSARRLTIRVLRTAFLSAFVLELVAMLGTAMVAVGLGLRLLNGWIAFREAMLVLLLVPEFYRPLRAVGAAFHAAMAGEEAVTRISTVLDASAETGRGVGSVSVSRDPPLVEFDHVSFSYGGAAQLALEDLSFRIAAGTTLALAGPSGAGKTTATQLLMGYAPPLRGTIQIGGQDLQSLDAGSWRDSIAWVPQSSHIFHGTVRDNLLLARPAATEAQLDEACALAHATDFVSRLPLGLATPLGERGARLSGGERQRLALARAFLRDAPLVILDEPTADLDSESEARIGEALARLRRDRTVLIVAHRVPTLLGADRIVVLSNGRVLEQGSPQELSRAGDFFPGLIAAWEGIR